MANNRAKVFLDVESTGTRAFGEVQRGFRDIEGASQRLRGALASLGVGLSVAGLTSFVRSGLQAADELNKLSQRVGVTVESLSALKFAAELSDVSIEQLSVGLRQLARNAADVQAGTGEAKEAFAALGVAVTDSAGNLRSTEDLLLDVSQQFAGIEDSAGKTAIALRLFGRSGTELIPLLNLGRQGFEELRAEAQRLGIVISQETAAGAEEFNDNMLRLTKTAEALQVSLVRDILPTIRAFADILLEVRTESDGADDSFSVINETLKAMGTGALVVASAFKALGRDIGAAAAAATLAIQGDFAGALDALKARGEDQVAELEQLASRIRRIQGELFGDSASGIGTRSARRQAPALRNVSQEKRASDELRKLQQEDLKGLLAGIDAEIQVFEDGLRATAQLTDETFRLRDGYRALIDPIQQFRVKLEEIDELERKGLLTQSEALEARFRVNEQIDEQLSKQGQLNDETQDGIDIARDLGLTFSSAFEDAVIEGRKFRDVLQGVAQDIARIILRRTVTEPLAGAISGLFSGGLKGIFGAAQGGIMPGGFHAFASGGVVTRPTLGLVGEGGQNEAVIPLPDGKNVPVKLEGGGNITVSVQVDARGGSVDSSDQSGLALGRRIEQAVRSVLVGEKRPGGLLAGA